MHDSDSNKVCSPSFILKKKGWGPQPLNGFLRDANKCVGYLQS